MSDDQTSEPDSDQPAAADAGPARLTRGLIRSGRFEMMIHQAAPGQKILSEAEREASLQAILMARPVGDAWVFGYGSLIWNPTVQSVEARTARIEGWHRAYCLASIAGRGSAGRPGLMLALERGGVCDGVAYRIADDDLDSELALLWRREMVSGAYVPRWLDLLDGQGNRFGSAVTFTVNQASERYLPDLPPDTLVHRLATGCGRLGTCAEYLLRTRDQLRAHGIPDPEIERLAALVEAVWATSGHDD
jgi:cation transport protein ChaC